MSASGEDEQKDGDVKASGEQRIRRDSIGMGENGKTVDRGCARVPGASPVF